MNWWGRCKSCMSGAIQYAEEGVTVTVCPSCDRLRCPKCNRVEMSGTAKTCCDRPFGINAIKEK